MEPDNRALPPGFLAEVREIEGAYLSADDPVLQSRFLGGPERWKLERELILDALTQDGDLLDVGCANGYLLECLVEWASARGLRLIPYGVDIGPQLIGLAKQRLPQYADHFWVANAWEWRPPRRFRYVYALHDCVPGDYLQGYVERLLAQYVSPDGTLIVGAYGSYSRHESARDLARDLTEWGFQVAGRSERGALPAARVAWVEASRPRRE